MFKKVLITGGAGAVGSYLVEALINQGCFVVVVDNLSSGSIENLKHMIINFPGSSRENRSRSGWKVGWKLYKGSIANDIFLRKVFEENKDLDFCFHLSAIVSVPYSIVHKKETFAVNYEATKRLLRLCKKYYLQGMVFAGSAAEYGDEKRLPIKEEYAREGRQLSPYGESKYLATEFVASHNSKNFNAVSLRFFNIYGSRQDSSSLYSGVISRFMEAVVDKKDMPVYGDGQQTRDFVFVDDVVRAILSAAENKSNQAILNIGSGKSVTINNLAKLINKIGGNQSQIIHLPKRSDEIRYSQADISKAKNFLNWIPYVGLKEGLKKTF